MAKTTFLDFEQPIAELEAKIDELRFVQDDSAVDISEEIDRLQAKSQGLLKEIYAKLTPWQVSQLARHPQRPYTLDYVGEMFTDFHELHGSTQSSLALGEHLCSVARMSEAIVALQVKASPVRRRAMEGALGMLVGVVFACVNGPWLLSLLYTPPSGDALSCGPTVNNALAYFVKLQLVAGVVGGGAILVGSFFFRRMLRKRRDARGSAGA